jgi:hypothetical protein
VPGAAAARGVWAAGATAGVAACSPHGVPGTKQAAAGVVRGPGKGPVSGRTCDLESSMGRQEAVDAVLRAWTSWCAAKTARARTSMASSGVQASASATSVSPRRWNPGVESAPTLLCGADFAQTEDVGLVDCPVNCLASLRGHSYMERSLCAAAAPDLNVAGWGQYRAQVADEDNPMALLSTCFVDGRMTLQVTLL